jgi:hypothetical protein
MWYNYFFYLDRQQSQKMKELIGEIQVWLKAKGLYKQAIEDIENLKYFDIKYLFIRGEEKKEINKSTKCFLKAGIICDNYKDGYCNSNIGCLQQKG